MEGQPTHSSLRRPLPLLLLLRQPLREGLLLLQWGEEEWVLILALAVLLLAVLLLAALLGLVVVLEASLRTLLQLLRRHLPWLVHPLLLGTGNEKTGSRKAGSMEKAVSMEKAGSMGPGSLGTVSWKKRIWKL